MFVMAGSTVSRHSDLISLVGIGSRAQVADEADLINFWMAASVAGSNFDSMVTEC